MQAKYAPEVSFCSLECPLQTEAKVRLAIPEPGLVSSLQQANSLEQVLRWEYLMWSFNLCKPNQASGAKMYQESSFSVSKFPLASAVAYRSLSAVD